MVNFKEKCILLLSKDKWDALIKQQLNNSIIKEIISNQSSFPAQKDIISPTDVFSTLQETENYYMIQTIFENRKEGRHLNSSYKAHMSLMSKLQDNTKRKVENKSHLLCMYSEWKIFGGSENFMRLQKSWLRESSWSFRRERL